jgi:site-specific DNA-methyltransferase (cytosine-N4-specific)
MSMENPPPYRATAESDGRNESDTRSPYYTDDSVTLWHGDSLDVLREMPSSSVDCCVTSPPYFGLRDYGEPGQLGLEASPAEYVENMRALFAEVRRVLAEDGTLWLNLGDSYYSGRGNPGPNSDDRRQVARRGWKRPLDQPGASWAKPKDLLGVPWRVAFALQDDGWTLRNAVVWNKPNAMPESVTDRLSNRYETVFMFSRARFYWFDLDPIREPLAYPDAADGSRIFGGANKGPAHRTGPGSAARRNGNAYVQASEAGKNPGDVWSISTSPFPGAHFATMPVALAERCLLAGCKPSGTVLDPFSGSGTTGLAAARHGRKYVGIDLSREYLDLSLRTRLSQPAMFGEEAS